MVGFKISCEEILLFYIVEGKLPWEEVAWEKEWKTIITQRTARWRLPRRPLPLRRAPAAVKREDANTPTIAASDDESEDSNASK
jgi:hypothetical protein